MVGVTSRLRSSYERGCQGKKLLPAPREDAGMGTYIQPHQTLRGVIGLAALARRALADVRTLQLGQQIEEQKTARKEKTVRVDRMRRQANRMDIPAVMVDDDPETQRGLELMAEAERDHQRGCKREPATLEDYQLNPAKTFTPKPGK